MSLEDTREDGGVMCLALGLGAIAICSRYNCESRPLPETLRSIY